MTNEQDIKNALIKAQDAHNDLLKLKSQYLQEGRYQEWLNRYGMDVAEFRGKITAYNYSLGYSSII